MQIIGPRSLHTNIEGVFFRHIISKYMHKKKKKFLIVLSLQKVMLYESNENYWFNKVEPFTMFYRRCFSPWKDSATVCSWTPLKDTANTQRLWDRGEESRVGQEHQGKPMLLGSASVAPVLTGMQMVWAWGGASRITALQVSESSPSETALQIIGVIWRYIKFAMRVVHF